MSCIHVTSFLSNQIFKQYLPVALRFTLGTNNYEEGVITKSPLIKILGQHQSFCQWHGNTKDRKL